MLWLMLHSLLNFLEAHGPSVPVAAHPPAHAAAVLSDFPTYHPLLVHFPIVLLTLVPLLLVALHFSGWNRSLHICTSMIAVAGLLSGTIAAFLVHPHTDALSVEAAATLAAHETWAYASLAAAFICGIAAVLSLKRSDFLLRWMFAASSLSACVCIAVAGHAGAKLTHVHNVGPGGSHLTH